MEFDLRTCDSALNFIINFMNMTEFEFMTDYMNKSGNDFENFWNRNLDRIKSVDISKLRIMAFHVLASLDNCEEIKKRGIMNLQRVLTSDTILSHILMDNGIVFDIQNKILNYNGKQYDINYEHYKGRNSTDMEERISKISRRVFDDFFVNGFLANDDIFGYITEIHRRPEFLKDLSELLPEAKKVEEYWRENAKSYRIDFYATIDQTQRFNFSLDELDDPPFEDWIELNDDMKVKKWMLSAAIKRYHDNIDEEYLYIKDNVTIPPKQIISYTLI